LDKTQKVEYDAINNPNYLRFTVVDSTGKTLKVVYHNAKPDNLEISDKLVLKGKYNTEGHFDCKDIQTKCPSKYKDDITNAGKEIEKSTSTQPAATNSEATKY
jgi:cytochrome c-type biogenesis protein CcmE